MLVCDTLSDYVQEYTVHTDAVSTRSTENPSTGMRLSDDVNETQVVTFQTKWLVY